MVLLGKFPNLTFPLNKTHYTGCLKRLDEGWVSLVLEKPTPSQDFNMNTMFFQFFF